MSRIDSLADIIYDNCLNSLQSGEGEQQSIAEQICVSAPEVTRRLRDIFQSQKHQEKPSQYRSPSRPTGVFSCADLVSYSSNLSQEGKSFIYPLNISEIIAEAQIDSIKMANEGEDVITNINDVISQENLNQEDPIYQDVNEAIGIMEATTTREYLTSSASAVMPTNPLKSGTESSALPKNSDSRSLIATPVPKASPAEKKRDAQESKTNHPPSKTPDTGKNSESGKQKKIKKGTQDNQQESQITVQKTKTSSSMKPTTGQPDSHSQITKKGKKSKKDGGKQGKTKPHVEMSDSEFDRLLKSLDEKDGEKKKAVKIPILEPLEPRSYLLPAKVVKMMEDDNLIPKKKAGIQLRPEGGLGKEAKGNQKIKDVVGGLPVSSLSAFTEPFNPARNERKGQSAPPENVEEIEITVDGQLSDQVADMDNRLHNLLNSDSSPKIDPEDEIRGTDSDESINNDELSSEPDLEREEDGVYSQSQTDLQEEPFTEEEMIWTAKTQLGIPDHIVNDPNDYLLDQLQLIDNYAHALSSFDRLEGPQTSKASSPEFKTKRIEQELEKSGFSVYHVLLEVLKNQYILLKYMHNLKGEVQAGHIQNSQNLQDMKEDIGNKILKLKHSFNPITREKSKGPSHHPSLETPLKADLTTSKPKKSNVKKTSTTGASSSKLQETSQVSAALTSKPQKNAVTSESLVTFKPKLNESRQQFYKRGQALKLSLESLVKIWEDSKSAPKKDEIGTQKIDDPELLKATMKKPGILSKASSKPKNSLLSGPKTDILRRMLERVDLLLTQSRPQVALTFMLKVFREQNIDHPLPQEAGESVTVDRYIRRAKDEILKIEHPETWAGLQAEVEESVSGSDSE